MARFYTNENIPLPVVAELRRMRHDVLTSLDSGKANASVRDVEVLAFAVSEGRILISYNRRHFLNIHRYKTFDYAGIVLCTFDLDFRRQALRTDLAVTRSSKMSNVLIRVNREA